MNGDDDSIFGNLPPSWPPQGNWDASPAPPMPAPNAPSQGGWPANAMPTPNQFAAPPGGFQSNLSPTDRDTAIKTMLGEVSREPMLGQAAMAHVLKNRVDSGQFADGTLAGVAQQPAPGRAGSQGYHEFSTWNPPNKQGNNPQNISPNDPAYQHMGRILDGVFSGDIPDPTGGATHYYNPRQSKPPWGPTLAQANDVTIGAHRFVGTGPAGPGARPPVPGPLASAGPFQ
jgi:spore germination cell wall hydrolase CwlJ-like protein